MNNNDAVLLQDHLALDWRSADTATDIERADSAIAALDRILLELDDLRHELYEANIAITEKESELDFLLNYQFQGFLGDGTPVFEKRAPKVAKKFIETLENNPKLWRKE